MATATKNGATTEPAKTLESQLSDRIQKIEELLPDQLKGKADWFVKRALLTFHGNDSLHKCTAASFITSVIKGAEIGLPIDGKLGYAVAYFNNKKGVSEAQFMPSYMGLCVVAKRSGQITNVYGRMIYAGDHFKHAKMGDTCMLEHTWQVGQPRGEPIGAYAVVKFPSGDWDYDIMDMAELDAIRGRSKAKSSGPWVSDPDQMRIKTVIRRTLKLHCNDPGFILAVQLDEHEYEGETANNRQRATRSPLNDRIGLPAPKQVSQFEQDMAAAPVEEVPTFVHAEPAEVPEQHTQQMEAADWTEVINELSSHLDAADASTIEAVRKWAKKNHPEFPDTDTMVDERKAELAQK